MNDEYLDLTEKTLDEVLPKPVERPAVLSEAMRYAVGTGGKRIRPLVCLASAVAVGGKAEDARFPAAAIELLHNYTLVHDDLPAMDDDTERRGERDTRRRRAAGARVPGRGKCAAQRRRGRRGAWRGGRRRGARAG